MNNHVHREMRHRLTAVITILALTATIFPEGPIMAPISESLCAALDQLSQQIREAEFFLRKAPGAGKACVELHEGILGDNHWLEVMHDEGDTRICVRFASCGYATDGDDLKPITDYPVSIRIELAEFIGHLLDSAVSFEGEVEKEAVEAANSIEQALEKVRNDD